MFKTTAIFLKITHKLRRLRAKLPFGLRSMLKGLSNREHTRASSMRYYEQVDSCQLPTLWFLLEKYIGQLEDGLLVEVGANDGLSFSNSYGPIRAG